MNMHPFSRRHMLTTMSSGIGWLAFSALAQKASAKSGLVSKMPHFPARAKRVIFLTMRGGPSHVDLFDHKPELMRSAMAKRPRWVAIRLERSCLGPCIRSGNLDRRDSG